MSGGARRGPLLSVAAAADLWGRSRSATYESARRGELPGLVRLNGRYYVRRAVFEAWLGGLAELVAVTEPDAFTHTGQQKAAMAAARGGA